MSARVISEKIQTLGRKCRAIAYLLNLRSADAPTVKAALQKFFNSVDYNFDKRGIYKACFINKLPSFYVAYAFLFQRLITPKLSWLPDICGFFYERVSLGREFASAIAYFLKFEIRRSWD